MQRSQENTNLDWQRKKIQLNNPQFSDDGTQSFFWLVNFKLFHVSIMLKFMLHLI